MPAILEKIRIVCISDTHNKVPGEGYTLPEGDILIHAGDLTNQGSYSELKKAIDWLEKAEYPVKLVVPGNHDLSLDAEYSLKHEQGWSVQSERVDECRELFAAAHTVTYLEHGSTLVHLPGRNVSLKVFGSPYSPDRGRQNWAFQYRHDEDLWEEIPKDTDVVISHTPPKGHCDASKHWEEGGCPALADTLWHVKPLLHVCGHCHEGRGAEVIRWGGMIGEVESVRTWQDPGVGNKKLSSLDLTSSRGMELKAGEETAVVNASIMAKSYGRGAKQFNKPVVVCLEMLCDEDKAVAVDGVGNGEHGE